MLEIGDSAPGFELPDDSGATVSLSAELESGPLLLYFYPADFTPGCTAQACVFRDRHAELAEAGVNVLGVSPQSVASHAKFREAKKLPFRLLADTDKSMIKSYGMLAPLGIFTRRGTFWIGQDGIVKDRVLADLNIGKHGKFIDRVLSGG